MSKRTVIDRNRRFKRSRGRGGRHLLLSLVAGVAVSSSAWAQPWLLTLPESPIDPEEPASIEVMTEPNSGSVVPLPLDPTTEAPADEAFQSLMNVEFDRRPAQMLELLAAVQSGEVSPGTNRSEQLRVSVNLGRWDELARLLRELPSNQGMTLYERILTQINRIPSRRPGDPSFGGTPFPPTVGGRGVKAPQPVLSPDDVLGLARATPGDLTSNQLQQLGALLRSCASAGYATDAFVKQLRGSLDALGGADSDGRSAAVKLLLAAGLPFDAREFLVPLPQAEAAADFDALLHHAQILAMEAPGQAGGEPVQQAWDIYQSVMNAPSASSTNQQVALSGCLELIDRVEEDVRRQWLRVSFLESPERGLAILANLAAEVEANRSNRDVQSRAKDLERQSRVTRLLLEVHPKPDGAWRTALNLLALNWQHEAEMSLQFYRPPMGTSSSGSMIGYDAYGNPMFMGSPPPQPDQNRVPALPPAQVVETAKAEEWLEGVDASLIPRLRVLQIELYLKDNDIAGAKPGIEWLAKTDPKQAQRLAGSLVDVWMRTLTSMPQSGVARYNGLNSVYYAGSYGYRQSSGIALTRARQQRNLQELAELIAWVRALPIEPVAGKQWISAFSSAHGHAEVYRLEDIEQVFGVVGRVDQEILAGLLQDMRQRLAAQWREPRLQQAEKTRRTDKEIELEVLRGYAVVNELLDTALRRSPDDWRLQLVQAALLFDLAEFQYGKKVDLEIYVEKRESAFEAFARAAALYRQQLPNAPDEHRSVDVYSFWFNANLGASDLAFVTRQFDPEESNLRKIREAMLALSDDEAERHLALFGEMLAGNAQSLRPELKPRYLRSGLMVLGEHESGKEARELVDYYTDLLGEVAFEVVLDGNAEVGHSEPFGVQVNLLHTASIEREAGGFSSYLRQPNQSPYYVNSRPGQLPLFVEDFDQQAREKLADSFEIQSLTFHDVKVQSRGTDRPGWRRTPLAYLVLKAKDASVDQLPSLQMDLAFIDRFGPVVLPVASQLQVLDARPETTAPRPIQSLEIVQILDDRGLKNGVLTLEVRCQGKGILPRLESLLDLDDYAVADLEDHELALTGLDTEGETLAPICERTWTVHFKPYEPDQLPTQFQFAPLRLAATDAAVSYKRYEDVDLVEVPAEIALSGLPLSSDPPWQWLIAGLIFVVVALPVVRRMFRRAASTGAEPDPYQVPETMEPFVILDLLRRMEADQALPLTSSHREELRTTVRRLEERYFGRIASTHQVINLEAVVDEWFRKAKLS